MRRVIDLAYPQLEYEDGSPQPVDYSQLATAADAFLIRWTDYAYYLSTGWQDTQYVRATQELQSRGVPTGPYLYAGAGFGASARQQIDTWAAATPFTPTFFPMYDLEQTVITGNQLTDWVNEALQRMTEIWGMRPILYLGPFKPGEWQLAEPSVPCLLLVAEYPTTGHFAWSDRHNWETHLYNYPGWGGGPDPLWGKWHLWQAMSTAVGIPGLAPDRLTDVSFAQDSVFELLGGSLGTSAVPAPTSPIAAAPTLHPLAIDPVIRAYPVEHPVVALTKTEYAA